VTTRTVTRVIGAGLFLVTVASACLAVVGIVLARGEHAPAWGLMLLYSVVCISITLSGTIGYLFSIPNRQ
jgi:hypothetical protein